MRYGVDITGYALLTTEVGLRAIEFAAAAHAGQLRLTGQVRLAQLVLLVLLLLRLVAVLRRICACCASTPFPALCSYFHTPPLGSGVIVDREIAN